MTKEIQIREALENTEANIAFMAALPDSFLAEKLDTIHQQSVIAEEKKLTASIELLEIWRSQVIQARIYKAENKIPDSANEIDLAIADIETRIAITEERQQALAELTQPVQPSPSPKPQEKSRESQLKLF